MSRYEKYKDSGIAWIGEIPQGWSTVKIKNISLFLNGYAFDSSAFKKQGEIPVIRIGDITDDVISICDAVYVDEDIALNRFEIYNRDLLIAMSGATVGKTGIALNIGKSYINQRVGIIRTNQIHFIKYMFKTCGFKDYVVLSSLGSAQPNISADGISNFPIPLPSIAEQEVIAEFLDGKCEEVDRLVGLQQAMIEELVAYKQSVITECVTKGLDPSAPLRDSGIPWIGSIPAHWEVMKTTQMFNKIGSGTTPKSSNEAYYVQDGINWLQTGDLTDDKIYETSKKISQEAYDSHSLRLYPQGSIVIALYGATIGKLGLLEIETTTNQACCVLGDSSKCIPLFGFYSLIAARKYILTLAYGGGQPNISQETIKGLRLCLPPLQEQQAIADHLDRKCEEIDNLITIKREKIEQLKEYKKSIIFEYVTGKKRVMQ